MKDKICLITGTASGMGRIAAKSLAEKGATLILVDFDTENGLAARDEIIEATGNNSIEYIDCDVFFIFRNCIVYPTTCTSIIHVWMS